MELIIVVIIIGVLAAIALPSYRIQMLKIKNQEGVRILMALWEGQKDYHRENGVYATDRNNLDVTIPSSKHFQDPELNDTSTRDCNGTPRLYLAKILTQRDGYGLYVLEDGRVVCEFIDCHDPICIRMGFEDNW